MISERWVRKYMRLAKQFGEDDNRCYSRQIGTVLVDPERNEMISMGLNGPPKGTPPCDSREYLQEVFWPQLTTKEREKAFSSLSQMRGLHDISSALVHSTEHSQQAWFLDKATDCRTCPRRLIEAGPGQRTELSSCLHSEQNAVLNAGRAVDGAWAFCYCCVPCWECAKVLVQKGVRKVFCLEQPDYHEQSRVLFRWAGVELVIHTEAYYLDSQ